VGSRASPAVCRGLLSAVPLTYRSSAAPGPRSASPLLAHRRSLSPPAPSLYQAGAFFPCSWKARHLLGRQGGAYLSRPWGLLGRLQNAGRQGGGEATVGGLTVYHRAMACPPAAGGIHYEAGGAWHILAVHTGS